MIGDTHGEIGNILGPARMVGDESFDAVLQLGDFGGVTHGHFAKMISGCRDFAKTHGKPVFFVDGNHESFPDLKAFQSDDEVAFWDRGTRWVIGGKKFGALGGAYSVDWRSRQVGFDWHPDDELPTMDQVMALGPDELDVLVTHDVGYRSLSDDMHGFTIPMKDELRSAQCQYVVQMALDFTRPKWHFHAHWHSLNLKTDDRSGTKVVGLGCTPRSYNHVIFDTDTMTVSSEDEGLQRKLDVLNEWTPSG